MDKITIIQGRIIRLHADIEKCKMNEAYDHEYIDQIAEYARENYPTNNDLNMVKIQEHHADITRYYLIYVKRIEEEIVRLDCLLEHITEFITLVRESIPEFDPSQPIHNASLQLPISTLNIEISFFQPEIPLPWFCGRFVNNHITADKQKELFDIPNNILRVIAEKMLAWPDYLPKTRLRRFLRDSDITNEMIMKPLRRMKYLARENKQCYAYNLKKIYDDLHNDLKDYDSKIYGIVEALYYDNVDDALDYIVQELGNAYRLLGDPLIYPEKDYDAVSFFDTMDILVKIHLLELSL